jgi:hypothetical protein
MTLKQSGNRVEAMNTAGILSRADHRIMCNSFESPLPSDIRLLLRADAERHWLHREVIPVLEQVETHGEIPEEQVGAALAYLEAMWNEATVRARRTDAAHTDLCSHEESCDGLADPASRYHAAVRVLRGIIAERVTPFVSHTAELDSHQAQTGGARVRIKDARSGGCAPRAA